MTICSTRSLLEGLLLVSICSKIQNRTLLIVPAVSSSCLFANLVFRSINPRLVFIHLHIPIRTVDVRDQTMDGGFNISTSWYVSGLYWQNGWIFFFHTKLFHRQVWHCGKSIVWWTTCWNLTLNRPPVTTTRLRSPLNDVQILVADSALTGPVWPAGSTAYVPTVTAFVSLFA